MKSPAPKIGPRPASGAAPEHPLKTLPPPPRWLRWLLTGIGTLLVTLGVIGLALPVVPQVLPLALGAAALTLASDRLHQQLQRWLRRWPRAAAVIRRTRQTAHDRLVVWFPRHYARHARENPEGSGEENDSRTESTRGGPARGDD